MLEISNTGPEGQRRFEMLEVRFRLEHPPEDGAACDDRLGEILGAVYSEFDGVGYVTAYADSDNGDVVAETIRLARSVSAVGRVIVRECDADLVDLTEIALRCDVTHEAARSWAAGKRRVAEPFPSPSHVIAGRKLWDWSDINTWLKDVLPEKADTTRLLTRSERIRINFRLLSQPEQESAALWLGTSSIRLALNRVWFAQESDVNQPSPGQRVSARHIDLPTITTRS